MSQEASDATGRPTIRVASERRSEAVGVKGYRHTLTATDEADGRVLASCDVVGRVTTSGLVLAGAGEARFELQPNRAVLPSRWRLRDGAGQVCLVIDGEIGTKLLLPLSRTALVLCEPAGRELLRLADRTSSLAERVLGRHPSDWSLLRDGASVAALTRLPASRPHAPGLRAWLSNLLTPSDRAIVSLGDTHALSAEAALAMIALLDELTDHPS